MIISRMNDQQIDAFYALLEETNPDIDGAFRPVDLDETDIVVYLLNSWDEVAKAPGATKLPREFERVQRIKNPTLRYSFVANYTDGTSLLFFFYSAEAANFPALRCYALDVAIAASLEPEDDVENRVFVKCANGAKNQNE